MILERLLPTLLTCLLATAGTSCLAMPKSIKSQSPSELLVKRDTVATGPPCLLSAVSRSLAAVICSDQISTSAVQNSCRGAGVLSACYFDLHANGLTVTMCPESASLVYSLMQSSYGLSPCICGAPTTSNADVNPPTFTASSVDIGGANYASSSCPPSFCEAWFGSGAQYTCSKGLPVLSSSGSKGSSVSNTTTIPASTSSNTTSSNSSSNTPAIASGTGSASKSGAVHGIVGVAWTWWSILPAILVAL